MRVATRINQLKYLQGVLQNHPIYANVKSEENMKIFMQSHVFAVWDFMLLLKQLQRRLTCVDKIWRPNISPSSARFINQIVVGQETDIHPNGKDYISHFQLYLNAMEQVGADTKSILNFVTNVTAGKSIEMELKNKSIPYGVANFVMNTVNSLDKSTPYVAAQFFYGRQDPIPQMFKQFVSNMGQDKKFSMLRYYLQRHIDIDGDQHGPMAQKLMSELTKRQDPDFKFTNQSSINALEHRIKLWDNIYDRLQF